MGLIRAGTACPSAMFDDVLDATHKDYFATNNPRYEQRLVRELISSRNITALNDAAAKAYDITKNLVHFRGGFLHNNPHAEFTVEWPGGPKNKLVSKRELADALLVVYISQPDPLTGKPVIVERAACMLMFKVAKGKVPKTPAFKPGTDSLLEPNGDKEQFYLFNKWPVFDLLDRKDPPTIFGKFTVKGSNYENGKYAVVYTGKKQSQWKNARRPQPTNWLFADPVPQQAMSADPIKAETGSLGYLLEALVDRTQNVGRTFKKTSAFTIGSPGGWNELMSFLLGHVSLSGYQPGHLAQQETYLNESRDVNPAVRHLAHFDGEKFEHQVISAAKYYELFANNGYFQKYPDILEDLLFWPRFPNFTSLGEPAAEEEGMPVLIATVMKRKATDRQD